jgi:hypothetical protein
VTFDLVSGRYPVYEERGAKPIGHSAGFFMTRNTIPARSPDPAIPVEGDATSAGLAEQEALSSTDYELAHGEKLAAALNLDTWRPGTDLVRMYEHLSKEIRDAVRQETLLQREIRREIFPRLRNRPGAPPGGGVWEVPLEKIERTHNTLLFSGGVEAVDGTVVPFDTLPVTITQIGVVLVSYRGDQGSWVHRIFRRDLRTSGNNPVDETWDLLERRRTRSAVGYESKRDRLSSLAQRGIMAYAERAILLDRATAPWRLGHGSPTPYELVTGSGMPELLEASLDLMNRLVQYERFVFVPSATSARELLTIGNALRPMEYAVIDTNRDMLERIRAGHYRGEAWTGLGHRVQEFVDACADQILVGMYRVSKLAPAQMFYAHAEHVHQAAMVAMADSILEEHRGFPTLLGLADGICGQMFNASDFAVSAQLAYAEAGSPYQYLAERQTR